MDREYIAVGPNCWGKGSTAADAVKQMRANLPSMARNGDYVVYSCPPSTRVTEFDELAYPKNAEKPPFEVRRGSVNRSYTRRAA